MATWQQRWAGASRAPAANVQQAAVARMQAQIQVDLALMVRNALDAQNGAIDEMVETIGRTFGFYQRVNPELFTEAHRDVGQAALRSLQSGYRSRRYRRPAGQYRTGQDRLSGTLSKALGSSAHINATPNGLEFLNTALLDREAAHWRRLNFGAGAGSKEGITPPQQFPITWGGLLVGTLGLETQPSAPFRIPRGYWIGPEGRVGASASRLGRDQFFLVGMVGGIKGRPSRGVQTAGIASRNFVDAAVRRIANDLPTAYENIYEHLYNNARKSLEFSANYVGSRVVTPRTPARQRLYRRPASRGAV